VKGVLWHCRPYARLGSASGQILRKSDAPLAAALAADAAAPAAALAALAALAAPAEAAAVAVAARCGIDRLTGGFERAQQ